MNGGCTRRLACLLPLVLGAAPVAAAPGIDRHVGAELNPSGGTVLCTPDPQGLQLFARASRTPGGMRVEAPCLGPDTDPNGDGWIVYGALEAGVVAGGGDDGNAFFVEYADRGGGAVLSVVQVTAEQAATGHYAELDGGELGREDGWFRARFGRAGSYRVEAGMNRIHHVTAAGVRTPYDGVGSGRLTLPAAVPPGSVQAGDGDGSASALATFVAARPVRDLAVERTRANLAGELRLDAGARLYADYRHERRDGTKAYAGSFNFDFIGLGGVNELVQPIDYASDDLVVGLGLDGARWQLDLRYDGSWFRNRIDSLVYDNPWRTGFAYVPLLGETDLYPDNAAHRVAIDGVYRLPWHDATLNVTVARGRMTQDDALLPFTRNAGTIGGIDLDDWNDLAALPRRTADARIDTALERVQLAFRPFDRVDARLRYRRQAEDDRSAPFAACNALTGQCAFVLLDGGWAGLGGIPERFRLFDPDAGVFANFRYRNVPWDVVRRELAFALDWRPDARTTLGLDVEAERIERSHREVAATDETKVALRVVRRAGAWGTLRARLGRAQRDPDGPYDPHPYRAFTTEALLAAYIADPATAPADAAAAQAALDALPPHTLAELRKSDLAGRDLTTLALKWNLAVDDRTDLVLTLDIADADFAAAYGLGESRELAAGVELSRAPGAGPGWHVGYRYQARRSTQANIDDAGFGSDPAAGGSVYPLNAAWTADERERGHYAAAGATLALPAALTLGIEYAYGITATRVGYTGPGGSGSFDDLVYREQRLTANLRGRLGASFAWRLFVQHERGRLEDFHYADTGNVVDGMLLLGNPNGRWSATTVGLFGEYRF